MSEKTDILFARFVTKPLKQLKRLVIFVVGITVVAIGIIMIVTPGPATVVIPLGLGILSLEFAWAKRLLEKAKEYAKNTANKITGRGAPESKMPR